VSCVQFCAFPFLRVFFFFFRQHRPSISPTVLGYKGCYRLIYVAIIHYLIIYDNLRSLDYNFSMIMGYEHGGNGRQGFRS